MHGSAAAGPVSDAHPLHRLVERERPTARVLDRAIEARSLGLVPRRLFTTTDASALDCEHAAHDIRLDPKTGETAATLELRVRANGKALSSIGFAFDEGLTVVAASADGRAAAVTDDVFTPARVGRIDLSPPLLAGESTTVRVAYAGTLACGAYPDGGGVVCSKGRDFSYFAHQSVFPYLYDPDDPSSAALDGVTRDIVLRVPAGIDVVATGQRVSDTLDADGGHVSSWTIDEPLSRTLGLYVFAGRLGLTDVPWRGVPTTLVYPAPEQAVDRHLASWSSPVLDFVERTAGAPLPFTRSLSLVRLPSDLGDPGTATFGMTLLSDSYVSVGDLMHEETWAHENSHLFWGIVVPETDANESRLMSEGMATLTELDYSFSRHFADEDRDEYLARRFVPIGLDLRQLGGALPPVQLAPGTPLPDGFRTHLYTLWAYYKTAATLDHLRATVGEDVFQRALVAYVERCRFVGCRPDALRDILERISGRDLGAFFARWVRATTRPEVRIAFTPTGNEGADVTLSKDDELPMTLELWIRLEDGGLLRRRVDLGGRSTPLRIDTPGPVRSIATNPRHDLLVDARSSIAGDLDFDGETDGLDILRCARLVGKTYTATGAVGLWNADETFDPRCDLDGDFDIDDDDLAKLSESFGSLRSAR